MGREHRRRPGAGAGEGGAVGLGHPAVVHVQQPDRVAGQPEAHRLGGEGLVRDDLVVQRLASDRQREAPVAVADEDAGGLGGHRLDVEVDVGIVLEAGAAPEGDIFDARRLEVGEPRVARGGLADDDRVGDAALDDALQVLERILVGPAEQHDQVEGMPAQRAARALQHGEQARIGAGREAAGRNHRGDDPGAAAAQAAPGLVRHIAGAAPPPP